MAVRSLQELIDLFIDELQSRAPQLTDTSEGSLIDAVSGSTGVVVREIQALVIDEFAKTFFETAHGPEITGGPDDLERLAVDHFGEDFARPGAQAASGILNFSRPTADAGDVLIEAGTVVSTAINAAGTVVRFATVSDVTMTGTSINASAEAVLEGTSGNAQANKITVIETSLTDPTISVTNSVAFSGGSEIETDAEYRETIRNLIQALRGGVAASLEAKAEAVAGIETAKAVELEKAVIEYDIGAGEPLAGADYFYIPYLVLYVADANGVASDELIAAVKEAIATVRAYGVKVNVESAMAVEVDWTASIDLNLSGPHYAELAADPSRITDAMSAYMDALDIGDDFIVADADSYMMSLFGPAGTGDLDDFATTIPSGDAIADTNEKIIPGTMAVE